MWQENDTRCPVYRGGDGQPPDTSVRVNYSRIPASVTDTVRNRVPVPYVEVTEGRITVYGERAWIERGPEYLVTGTPTINLNRPPARTGRTWGRAGRVGVL